MQRQYIFVNIASYADPDVVNTVESAIRMSSGDHHIHIGVCEQVTTYLADARVCNGRIPAHCRLTYDMRDEPLIGVGGARAATALLAEGEGYSLMIDAHTRFEPYWDTLLLDRLWSLPGRPIITCCMPKDPWQGYGLVPVTNLREWKKGWPTGRAVVANLPRDAYKARYFSANGAFGTMWTEDVPIDPHIMFHGEEFTLAARLWTAGYDLYHSSMPIMHGNFRAAGRPWEKPGWVEKNDVSERRCRILLGMEEIADQRDPALAELEQYGFGNARSFQEWKEFSGFNYRDRTAEAPWGEWPN